MVLINQNKRNWTRDEIKAEIVRRGSSLTRVALEAGTFESACRMALYATAHRSGERALSAFLGVSLQELFQRRYYPNGVRRSPLPKTARENGDFEFATEEAA